MGVRPRLRSAAITQPLDLAGDRARKCFDAAAHQAPAAVQRSVRRARGPPPAAAVRAARARPRRPTPAAVRAKPCRGSTIRFGPSRSRPRPEPSSSYRTEPSKVPLVQRRRAPARRRRGPGASPLLPQPEWRLPASERRPVVSVAGRPAAAMAMAKVPERRPEASLAARCRDRARVVTVARSVPGSTHRRRLTDHRAASGDRADWFCHSWADTSCAVGSKPWSR